MESSPALSWTRQKNTGGSRTESSRCNGLNKRIIIVSDIGQPVYQRSLNYPIKSTVNS